MFETLALKKSENKRMERKLRELRNEADLKYNMTENDFKSFVKSAAEAMRTDDDLDWTFLNSCGFVFAALTTVGKLNKLIWKKIFCKLF